MSAPLCLMLMYQVWWLMPAQMMSTSLCGKPSASAIIACPCWTPWHRPMVSTSP